MRWDPDAKYWHRLASVQISLVGALFSGLWAAIPAFQYLMPPLWFAVTCVTVSILVVIARLIDQPSIPKAGNPNA